MVHTRHDPSDLEWLSFIHDQRARPIGPVMVISYGGTPTASQRQELVRTFTKPQPTAILTSSPVMRGIVSFLRAFNPHMASFRLTEHERASDHLELSPEERSHALKLRRQLEVAPGVVDAVSAERISA